MLREIVCSAQEDAEPHRRWFSDHDLDLIVWQENGRVVSFQLCYGKMHEEHALVWRSPDEYSLNRVDEGPNHPGRPKPAPALIPEKDTNIGTVVDQFQSKSSAIEPELVKFIHSRLLQYEDNRKYRLTG